MSELTSRQWRFYNYLKEQAVLNQNRWVGKEEIHFALLGDYKLNNHAKSHDICAAMNSDMMAINRSEVIEKLIILKNNEFKIATEQEAREYIEKHRKQIENHAKRINKLVYKLRKNGQYELLSNSNVPMDQSQGREYVETFIERYN